MTSKSPSLTNVLGRVVKKFVMSDLITELLKVNVNYDNIQLLKKQALKYSEEFNVKGLRDLERTFRQELEAIREFNKKQKNSNYQSKKELLELVDRYIGRKLANDINLDKRELLLKTEAL